jgi:Arc/MetJ-type ribon-helix-helix transcriptional regulator
VRRVPYGILRQPVYVPYTGGIVCSVSTPVTARLDESVVDALDRVVRAGLAPTRGAAIARAVAEWLSRHGEDAVAHSYRQRYADADPEHDDLIARIGAVSAAAWLAADRD